MWTIRRGWGCGHEGSRGEERAGIRMRSVMAACLLVPWVGRAAETPGLGDAARTSAPTATVVRLKSLSIEELMKVEVATVTSPSKKPEKATDAPARVIVIDHNDILLRGYSTLKDVLRDLPGMETVEYYFTEIGTLVPVRGIVGNNKIVVLVNGMRVNPPGGENVPLRSDFSVREAERIEVVYGPGSTLYGQDAISAVINVITREPKGTTGDNEVGVAGGLNEEREGWASFGHVFGERGEGSVDGYVQYHNSELSRLDKDYPAWWADYRAVSAGARPAGLGEVPSRQDAGLNMFARVKTGDSAVQIWHRQSERSSSEGFSPVLGYLDEAKWGDSSSVIEGHNTLTLSDHASLESSISYNRYQVDSDSRYVFTLPSADGTGNEWFFNDFKYALGTEFSGEETLKMEITPDVSLLAGVVAGTFDIIPKSTVPGGADTAHDVVEQGGSFVYVDSAGVTRTIQRVVRERYDTYAAYLEMGWQLLPRLKAIAGARVTKDTRFNDIPVTPRGALVLNVTDDLTLKYVATRAYVAPAPYFGFATFDNGQLLATSNPDLDPETADSHEVDLDYAVRQLRIGVSGYYGSEQSLLIIADRDRPENVIEPVVHLPDGSSRVLVHTVNGGSSRNYGVDAYIRARLGDVSPWCSYSYVDFEEEQSGMTTGLMGISKHNGRLGATWAVTSRLFVTPSVVMRSTPENVEAGRLDEELKTPYEVNLHVLYNLTDHMDLFANVRNLTDHKYALGGVTGAAVPQETLSAVIGTRIVF